MTLPTPIKRTMLAGMVSMAVSQTATAAVTEEEFQALQEQLNLLADQVERNSTGSNDATTIGGYGELHYNNWTYDSGEKFREIDLHRFVLFFNHEFNDSIRLFTELEIEHALAGEGKNGEVEVEQAYVQFDLNDNTQLNGGVFLIPVGILNETHEPPTFYGVERNPIEKNIIPATWWEGGAMFSGQYESGLSYDLAVHSGLNVESDPAESKFANIRSGRQKTSNAVADNLAATARLKYTGMPGLTLSGTVQYQDDISQTANDGIDSATLFEAHARYTVADITLTGLIAQWDIDGTAVAAAGKDKQDGAYLEASYRINPQWGVFVRQNQWDNGGTGDTGIDQTDVGFNYWPHEDVVVKADYVAQDNNSDDFDGFNLGIGYQF